VWLQGAQLGGSYVLTLWIDGYLASTHFITFLFVLGVVQCGSYALLLFVDTSASVDVGRRLHETALASTLAAPCSWFDSHPVGLVRSRLVKDVESVDVDLPPSLLHSVRNLLNAASVLAMVAVGMPYAFVALFATIVPYCIYMQRWARNGWLILGRFTAGARSPFIAHAMQAMEGSSVIHAYASRYW